MKGGKYKLKFEDCSTSYSRQTGRTFKAKYYAHMEDDGIENETTGSCQNIVNMRHACGNRGKFFSSYCQTLTTVFNKALFS
jgi:hypothetical protein